jgi:addiction module HigA family antidote
MAKKRIPPVHPGEVLAQDFLEPLGISRYRLAREIGVPVPRVNDIARCRRGISADTALRLARYFGTSAEFWMNLQARYDLETARDALAGRLDIEVKPLAA